MVQVRYWDPYRSEGFITFNKFKSCRLHDLMRDLCLSKGQDERFSKVMELSRDKQYVDPCIGSSIRRLFIHLERVPPDNFVDMEESKSLRSLLLLSKGDSDIINLKQNIFTDIKEMKFLRILLLEGCRFEGEKLPSGQVGKLVLLKYLSLFESNVKELPASICYLPCLHTLDLRTKYGIILPNLIHKMKRLRHLLLKVWMVEGDELLILDGLKELETLVLGWVNLIRIVDLCKLTNLKLLQGKFQGNENISLIVNHIYRLRDAYVLFEDCDFSHGEEGLALLNKILICHSLIKLTILGPIGCNLPCFQIQMCRNLLELELHHPQIEGVDVMKVVGKFPMLKSLVLWGQVSVNSNIVMIWHAFDFPQLTYLKLVEIANLEKLEVEQGAMPSLSCLVIDCCKNLQMISDGLRFITTLQKLEITMPKEFNDRLRVVNGEAGADYHKISHIQLVKFWNHTENWTYYKSTD